LSTSYKKAHVPNGTWALALRLQVYLLRLHLHPINEEYIIFLKLDSCSSTSQADQKSIRGSNSDGLFYFLSAIFYFKIYGGTN